MRRNDLHGLLIIDACIENATSRSKLRRSAAAQPRRSDHPATLFDTFTVNR
jgi:hypothetical protein